MLAQICQTGDDVYCYRGVATEGGATPSVVGMFLMARSSLQFVVIELLKHRPVFSSLFSHPVSLQSTDHYSLTSLVTNWRRGGRLLRTHRVAIVDPDHGVVTSVALDTDWIVAGLANARIHVFSAHTGVLVRTLVGHELGVWAVNLVSAGGGWSRDSSPSDDVSEKKAERRGPGLSSTSGGGRSRTDAQEGSGPGLDHLLRHNRAPAGTNVVNPQGLDGLLPPSLRAALGLDAPRRYLGKMDAAAEARRKQDDVCGSSEGWGQPNALVVSGGCDKMVRVWDLKSGFVSLLFWADESLLTNDIGTVSMSCRAIPRRFAV